MNVPLVESLVAQAKELSEKMDAFKAEINVHEEAINEAYRKGEPVAREAHRVRGELLIALGLSAPPNPDPSQPGVGG